jgi:hypothetical protein
VHFRHQDRVPLLLHPLLLFDLFLHLQHLLSPFLLRNSNLSVRLPAKLFLSSCIHPSSCQDCLPLQLIPQSQRKATQCPSFPVPNCHACWDSCTGCRVAGPSSSIPPPSVPPVALIPPAPAHSESSPLRC